MKTEKEVALKMEEGFKEDYRFFKSYANLPIPLRREICCVVGQEPLSFHVVWLEIKKKTVTGAKALKQLLELKII